MRGRLLSIKGPVMTWALLNCMPPATLSTSETHRALAPLTFLLFFDSLNPLSPQLLCVCSSSLLLCASDSEPSCSHLDFSSGVSLKAAVPYTLYKVTPLPQPLFTKLKFHLHLTIYYHLKFLWFLSIGWLVSSQLICEVDTLFIVAFSNPEGWPPKKLSED